MMSSQPLAVRPPSSPPASGKRSIQVSTHAINIGDKSLTVTISDLGVIFMVKKD